MFRYGSAILRVSNWTKEHKPHTLISVSKYAESTLIINCMLRFVYYSILLSAYIQYINWHMHSVKYYNIQNVTLQLMISVDSAYFDTLISVWGLCSFVQLDTLRMALPYRNM